VTRGKTEARGQLLVLLEIAEPAARSELAVVGMTRCCALYA
jgi:hypothetical protein